MPLTLASLGVVVPQVALHADAAGGASKYQPLYEIMGNHPRHGTAPICLWFKFSQRGCQKVNG